MNYLFIYFKVYSKLIREFYDLKKIILKLKKFKTLIINFSKVNLSHFFFFFFFF